MSEVLMAAHRTSFGNRSHNGSLDNDGEWQRIASAPFDRELQLAVIDYRGTHALIFPCRRILDGWVKADTKERIDVQPTHWREWKESLSVFSRS
jgi:hypothetical protein